LEVVSDYGRVFEGCLDRHGRPRLGLAREQFLGHPQELGFSTFAESLQFGERLFSFWRDFSEFLVLKKEYVGSREGFKDQYFAVKCSKRGNDVYQRRIKMRFDWLNREVTDRKFFQIKDFQVNEQVKTSLLWITLSYDPNIGDLKTAWQTLGESFNRFMSNLRRNYGRISYLRVWESYESGFPHVHVIMYFHDTKFSVFPHWGEDRGELKLTFRIQEKDEISQHWHSHVDIQAISSLSNVFTYLKKHQEKVILGLSGSIQEGEKQKVGFDVENIKGLRTLFLCWIFRKRSFSVSGDFREKLLDLISHLHNSNILEQVDLMGNALVEWRYVFLGVFSGEELQIPAFVWVQELDQRMVHLMLEKRERGKYGYG